jgi:hypothetical protein
MLHRHIRLLVCAGVLAGSADGIAAEPEPVQAIWKPQEITFYFQSFTTFYSCSGLESKVERILEELGAEAKVTVRSADCSLTVARMPRVIIEAISPVEATPEALAEREKGRSTRELVARVQGKRAEDSDVAQPFPAQWRPVSLSRGQLDLEPGDCELMQELRKKVLPKLAVRITEDQVQCTPHQVTFGQPRLQVEALVALPKPDEKGPDKKGRDEKGPDKKGSDASQASPTDKPEDEQRISTGASR